jgi:hypothetical protein
VANCIFWTRGVSTFQETNWSTTCVGIYSPYLQREPNRFGVRSTIFISGHSWTTALVDALAIGADRAAQTGAVKGLSALASAVATALGRGLSALSIGIAISEKGVPGAISAGMGTAATAGATGLSTTIQQETLQATAVIILTAAGD